MSVLLSAIFFPSPKISFPSPYFVSPTDLLFSLLILLTFPFPSTDQILSLFKYFIALASYVLILRILHYPTVFLLTIFATFSFFSFPLLTKYFRSPNIFPLILFFSCADRMYNFFKRYTLWTFSSSQKYTLLQKNPLCKCKASSVLKFPFVAHFISR